MVHYLCCLIVSALSSARFWVNRFGSFPGLAWPLRMDLLLMICWSQRWLLHSQTQLLPGASCHSWWCKLSAVMVQLSSQQPSVWSEHDDDGFCWYFGCWRDTGNYRPLSRSTSHTNITSSHLISAPAQLHQTLLNCTRLIQQRRVWVYEGKSGFIVNIWQIFPPLNT